MKKVVARIKGGLGNQLFCYSVARRLALVNNAELVIDDVTGFIRDYKYRRRYMLDCFNLPVRKATQAERLEPFERYRRGFLKWSSRRLLFEKRPYIEQEGLGFDQRVLKLKVEGTVYLDGYWQSEQYFKDVEEIIRRDLSFKTGFREEIIKLAEAIKNVKSVGIHVRRLHGVANHSHAVPLKNRPDIHLDINYYHRAIDYLRTILKDPHFFVFADYPQWAWEKIKIDCPLTFVNHSVESKDYEDLWLLSLCKHHITSNSSFSWWGAWLKAGKQKKVVCPTKILSNIAPWGIEGQIPSAWVQL